MEQARTLGTEECRRRRERGRLRVSRPRASCCTWCGRGPAQGRRGPSARGRPADRSSGSPSPEGPLLRRPQNAFLSSVKAAALRLRASRPCPQEPRFPVGPQGLRRSAVSGHHTSATGGLTPRGSAPGAPYPVVSCSHAGVRLSCRFLQRHGFSVCRLY